MIRLLGKYGGIATGKAYMKLIGLDCGKFRLPVRNMGTDNFELFKKEVGQLGFSNFCSKNLLHKYDIINELPPAIYNYKTHVFNCTCYGTKNNWYF